MTDRELYLKCRKVVDSCVTKNQRASALNYVSLAFNALKGKRFDLHASEMMIMSYELAARIDGDSNAL